VGYAAQAHEHWSCWSVRVMPGLALPVAIIGAQRSPTLWGRDQGGFSLFSFVPFNYFLLSHFGWLFHTLFLLFFFRGGVAQLCRQLFSFGPLCLLSCLNRMELGILIALYGAVRITRKICRVNFSCDHTCLSHVFRGYWVFFCLPLVISGSYSAVPVLDLS
jgi:hypothetical protein